MEFALKIDMGNEAMQTPYDAAIALRNLADALDARERWDEDEDAGVIIDPNGNTVGRWSVDEPDVPVVIVARDPDASNEWTVFAEGVTEPEGIDIDFGYADLGDKDEFRDWYESHMGEIQRLEDAGTPNRLAAALHMRLILAEAASNFDMTDEVQA